MQVSFENFKFWTRHYCKFNKLEFMRTENNVDIWRYSNKTIEVQK